jgi:YihY family inner membrane protein
MSTAARVPETLDLDGDDARAALRAVGRRVLLRDAFLRLRVADGFSHARSLAFVISLVLVEGIVALVGLASLLGDSGLGRSITRVLDAAAPGPAGEVLTDAVQQAREAGATNQYFGLAFGLAGALIAGATLMGQMERALNRLYGIELDRPTVEKYCRATVLACTAGVLATIAFVALGLGRAIESAIERDVARAVWAVIRWPLALGVITAAMAMLLRVAPRRRQPGWSWLAFGAGIGVLLWSVVTALLGLAFELSGSFGDTYGPLAGMLALLIWALLSSIAVLYGAACAVQLEAVRVEARGPQDAHKVARSEPAIEPAPLVGTGAP